jgi:diguanylate cyclase (GGDEF)-like protein/PAS domain S-box-containing protein
MFLLFGEAASSGGKGWPRRGQEHSMSQQDYVVTPRPERDGAGRKNGNQAQGEQLPARTAALELDLGRRIALPVLRAAALEASANSVIVTDRAGNVLWVNPAFTRVTGYAAEEVIGGTPRIWSSGQHPREFFKDLWDTILAGRVWHGTIINRRKDTTLYREEMTILPILSDRGEIVNFISIKQDVTEHERDTEMLRQSEERYRTLINNLPDMTWTGTQDGQTTYISQNVLNVYGYSPEEIYTRGEEIWPGRIHPDDLPRVLQDYRALFAQGQPFDVEYRIRRRDGEWIWVHDRALRTRVENGVHYADGVCFDITTRKQAELALLESEKRYRLLFENNLAAVFRAAAGGRILDCNPALVTMLGYGSREELLQRTTKEILYDPDDERVLIAALAQEGALTNYEIRLKRKDGSPVWALHNVSLAQGGIIEGTAFDITRRRRAEQELRDREDKLRLILESTAEAICGIDVQGRCTFSNSACVRLLGYRHPEELLGGRMHELFHHSRPDGSPLPAEECLIHQALGKGEEAHFDEDVFWKADGTSFPVEYWSYPQRKDGKIVGAVVAFIDISERKRAQERIQHLAYYDAVTGLPNRTLLEDRLSKALASARRRKEKLALLFLDLDRFKVINDSLGHAAGDLVLKEVAARLKQWAREQDTVARLGGDEFVVLLNAVKEAGDVAIAAKRALDALTAEVVIQGRSLTIGCSLGISLFPEHGRDATALIKNADAAMYCAKEKGRNNFQFFTPELNAQVMERLNLESDLRGALQKNELFLLYQPQSDLASGRLVGAEALLRWQHPKLGLIPPDKFIRIAENSGLIIPIGEWVLRTACAQARQWQKQGLPAIPVAVNVSAIQFRQEGFLDLIKRVLRETGLPPQCLELELTESLIMSNAEVIVSMLRRLQETGVRLSIDDFGTGYSSLSYLKHFPVYKLKVDRSFVRDIAMDSDDAAITGAIISMAKSLNLKAIAEGVETGEQIAFLRRHQCDEIQGYYFSKPLHAGDFAKFARREGG